MLLSVSMKMDTAVWCGWTTQPCAQKLNIALRAQVESSAMYLYLDVAGAQIELGFGFFGCPNKLDFGCLGTQINWTKADLGQVLQETQNELGLG